MTRRYQSKTQEIRNAQYRNFLKAIRENNKEKIDQGLNMGFRISNRMFVNNLLHQIESVLNRDWNFEIDVEATRLLNQSDINDFVDSGTILDIVCDLFAQAYEKEEMQSVKNLLVNAYDILVGDLIDMGAVLSNKPNFPKIIAEPNFDELMNIQDMLDEVDPTLEGLLEQEDEI